MGCARAGRRYGARGIAAHLVDGHARLIVVDARQDQVHPGGGAPRVAQAALESVEALQAGDVEVEGFQRHVGVDALYELTNPEQGPA